MRVQQLLAAAAFAVTVSAHATWQDLWINGVDYSASCVRWINSNNPVSVGSNDMACGTASPPSAPNTCSVKAGDTLTVEMHQQPHDRSCGSEAIGGQHYGPIMIYLGKVANASTASAQGVGWFKINDAGLVSNNPDYFANQVLNDNCGHWSFKIPTDIQSGDYLLRAETLALHAAGSSGGAQFYISCYQLNISGGGSASPPTVRFPGAYSASDPGVLVNIHQDLTTYVIPGPTPYGGQRATIATTAWPKAPTQATGGFPRTDFSTLPAGATTNPPGGGGSTTSTRPPTTPTTTTPRPPVTTTTTSNGAQQTKYGQCGGTGWAGPTVCVAGSTCTVLNQYYSQCV